MSWIRWWRRLQETSGRNSLSVWSSVPCLQDFAMHSHSTHLSDFSLSVLFFNCIPSYIYLVCISLFLYSEPIQPSTLSCLRLSFVPSNILVAQFLSVYFSLSVHLSSGPVKAALIRQPIFSCFTVLITQFELAFDGLCACLCYLLGTISGANTDTLGPKMGLRVAKCHFDFLVVCEAMLWIWVKLRSLGKLFTMNEHQCNVLDKGAQSYLCVCARYKEEYINRESLYVNYTAYLPDFLHVGVL